MPSGIYCIENKINGKKYVGQSQNLEIRTSAYHKGCVYLLRAIEYYGIENFDTYILEECSIEKINELEIYYIKELKTHISENGYNISWGGTAPMRNRKHTEESKEKMSKSKKGKQTGEDNPMFGIRGDKHPLFGKPLSEETKQKMRKPRPSVAGDKNPMWKKPTYGGLGKSHSSKAKLKISKAHTGKKEIRASSDYFGVLRDSRLRKDKTYWWKAFVYYNKKTKHIGIYKHEIDAAKTYNNYIIENNLPNPLNVL